VQTTFSKRNVSQSVSLHDTTGRLRSGKCYLRSHFSLFSSAPNSIAMSTVPQQDLLCTTQPQPVVSNVLTVMVAVRTCMVVACSLIDCCPEPSCLSVERLSFIEAWVITALWPKCSCCLVFSYVLCIVWAGCFCRTTIVMTIFWSLVCWNSVL